MARRTWVAAALVASTLVSLGSVARADCTPGNAFASATRAARVLVVRAAPAGARQQFAATLVVERALFGGPSPRAMRVQYNPLSGSSYTNGQRYVVFVDGQGTVEGGCSAVELARPEARNVVESLRDWFAAGTDTARVAVLVRKISESPSKIASDAASFLAASPALLAAVDATARAALIASIPSAHDERAYGLAWALGRLHAIDSLPAWIAWLGVAHNGANHRPVHDALELMTNRHDPGYTRGQDIHGEALRQIQQNWAQWERANRGQPAASFIAAGFRERRVSVRSLTDRAQLASALGAIARGSSDELSRQVLTNACEMSVRPAQSAMPHSFSAVDVTRALAVCAAP